MGVGAALSSKQCIFGKANYTDGVVYKRVHTLPVSYDRPEAVMTRLLRRGDRNRRVGSTIARDRGGWFAPGVGSVGTCVCSHLCRERHRGRAFFGTCVFRVYV